MSRTEVYVRSMIKAAAQVTFQDRCIFKADTTCNNADQQCCQSIRP